MRVWDAYAGYAGRKFSLHTSLQPEAHPQTLHCDAARPYHTLVTGGTDGRMLVFALPDLNQARRNQSIEHLVQFHGWLLLSSFTTLHKVTNKCWKTRGTTYKPLFEFFSINITFLHRKGYSARRRVRLGDREGCTDNEMQSMATTDQPPGSFPKPRKPVPTRKLHDDLLLVRSFRNVQEAVLVLCVGMGPKNPESDVLVGSAILGQR
ncbi:hypothetical protein BJV78DRAFT_1155771 [Lactifluus subvellereus]|nr:hypothetical protein BJV78DRAFT_1155771 [Lactifluus subvellereus]